MIKCFTPLIHNTGDFNGVNEGFQVESGIIPTPIFGWQCKNEFGTEAALASAGYSLGGILAEGIKGKHHFRGSCYWFCGIVLSVFSLSRIGGKNRMLCSLFISSPFAFVAISWKLYQANFSSVYTFLFLPFSTWLQLRHSLTY